MAQQPSTGHRWGGGPGETQNQGNILGDRPCVRQSKLMREHDGGNHMKDILGQTDLKWKTDRLEGAYEGQQVHDGLKQPTRAKAPPGETSSSVIGGGPQQQQQQQQQQQRQQQSQPTSTQQQQQQPATASGHRPGAGAANRHTFNLFTGEECK